MCELAKFLCKGIYSTCPHPALAQVPGHQSAAQAHLQPFYTDWTHSGTQPWRLFATLQLQCPALLHVTHCISLLLRILYDNDGSVSSHIHYTAAIPARVSHFLTAPRNGCQLAKAHRGEPGEPHFLREVITALTAQSSSHESASTPTSAFNLTEQTAPHAASHADLLGMGPAPAQEPTSACTTEAPAKCKAPPAQFLKPEPPALPADALPDDPHASPNIEVAETDGIPHASELH